MKKFKYILLLLATALTAVANAQVINGDLNHNNQLDPADVTLLIDNYLTGKAEIITGVGSTPFYADNSLVVGTWYRSATESITFNADGTTDYATGYTYEFLPSRGGILFYNAAGVPVDVFKVYKATSDRMVVVPNGSAEIVVYSKAYVSISQSEYRLLIDETLQLTATAVPSNAGNVNWTSSDESVATVKNGLVTAVGAGRAYITAERSGGRAVCAVDVISERLVEEIILSETSLMLALNDTHTLVATVLPSNASNKSLRWRTSAPSVVVPTATGEVKPVSVGTATITAYAIDGSGVEASCKVTVVEHHPYVDLGLSVKWATMNVGASSPEDYGDYFAWGETTTKTTYDWATYKWCNGSSSTITKYCTDSTYGTVDNKTVLDLSDDAARANWGGTWRMPTDAELTELREQCTWTRTTQNGVNGYKVTSKTNGNSIFLPAAKYRSGSSLLGAYHDADYWSSSLTEINSNNAFYVHFNSNNVYRGGYNRSDGLSVRAVRP